MVLFRLENLFLFGKALCASTGYLCKVGGKECLGPNAKFINGTKNAQKLHMRGVFLTKPDLLELYQPDDDTRNLKKEDVVAFVTVKGDKLLSSTDKAFDFVKYKERAGRKLSNLDDNAMIQVYNKGSRFQLFYTRNPKNFKLRNKNKPVGHMKQKLSFKPGKNQDVFTFIPSKNTKKDKKADETDSDEESSSGSEAASEEESTTSEEESKSADAKPKAKSGKRKTSKKPQNSTPANLDDLLKKYGETCDELKKALDKTKQADQLKKDIEKLKTDLKETKNELNKTKKEDVDKAKKIEELEKETKNLEDKLAKSEGKKEKTSEGSNESSEPESSPKSRHRNQKRKVYQAIEEDDDYDSESTDSEDDCIGIMDKFYGCIPPIQLSQPQQHLQYNTPQQPGPSYFTPNPQSIQKMMQSLHNLMQPQQVTNAPLTPQQGVQPPFLPQQSQHIPMQPDQPSIDCMQPINLDVDCGERKKLGERSKPRRKHRNRSRC